MVIDSDGVRLAGAEIGGELTVGFVRLPHGTDLGPALAGLAGEYVDFSPTAELAPVVAHLTGAS